MSDILLSPVKKLTQTKAMLSSINRVRYIDVDYSFFMFKFKKFTVGNLFTYLNPKVILGIRNTHPSRYGNVHSWFNNIHTNVETNPDFFYRKECYGHSCLGSWESQFRLTPLEHLPYVIKDYYETLNSLGYWRHEEQRAFSQCETCKRNISLRYLTVRNGKHYCCYDKYVYKRKNTTLRFIPENVDISNLRASNIRRAFVICTQK